MTKPLSVSDKQRHRAVWREFWNRYVGKYRSRLEAHQRIQIYGDALKAGHTHDRAYALAIAPDAQLPDIVFEVAGRSRGGGCAMCARIARGANDQASS